MKTKPFSFRLDIGATDELSLRVSVAALVRVLFEHPSNGEWTLALERKARLSKNGGEGSVEVKSQPFGGAMRLLDLNLLRTVIDDFHFDSEESRAEQDFRIFIQPADWEAVRGFCLKHLRQPNDAVLESDPTRELTEEFYETMGIRLKPGQYTHRAVGTIVEDHPSPTENIQARGYLTVRIYRIFEARILDSALASAMIRNSQICSAHDLRALALQDARNGGVGRANTILALPFTDINAFYKTILLDARNQPVIFRNHLLDETVAAVLEGVKVPKYQRV